MILEPKPYRWACLATSFAMALDLTTEEFFKLVGHNGSEIIFPGLPEPLCRRGVHISEAVLVALRQGKTCTPLELMPQIASTNGGYWPVSVFYSCGNENNNFHIFAQIIREYRGVIECRTESGNWHAVGFERGVIYDPDGRTFNFSQQNCEARGLYTVKLWIIE